MNIDIINYLYPYITYGSFFMTTQQLIEIVASLIGISTAIYIVNRTIKDKLGCVYRYFLGVFLVLLVTFSLFYTFHKKGVINSSNEILNIGIVVGLFFMSLALLSFVMMKMNKATLHPMYEEDDLLCKFWNEFVKQEEPKICFNDRMTASIGGSRAYRFLIHIFKHQKCEQFFALDLAFSRWLELNEDESVVNISESIFSAIGEMCRQSNCSEFKRILCITENDLFNNQRNAVRVLMAIKNKEEEWNKDYNASLHTYVCVFPNTESHSRNGIVFTHSMISELVAELNDFALFIGDINIGIVEHGLNDPNIYIPVESSNFSIVKNEDEIVKMKKGFMSILKEAHPIDSIIGNLGSSQELD